MFTQIRRRTMSLANLGQAAADLSHPPPEKSFETSLKRAVQARRAVHAGAAQRDPRNAQRHRSPTGSITASASPSYPAAQGEESFADQLRKAIKQRRERSKGE